MRKSEIQEFGSLGVWEFGSSGIMNSINSKTLKLYKLKTAQAMFEYIILVVIIIAALVSMQIYIKRAVAGRWREAADGIGFQYGPLNTTSSFTTSTVTSRTENQSISDNTTISPGDTVKVMVSDSTFSTSTTRTGGETVGALSNNIWE